MNDSTFSFSDFQNLKEAEDSLHRQINSQQEENSEMNSPKQNSVNNILAYSKAISIRKSEQTGFIENLLN